VPAHSIGDVAGMYGQGRHIGLPLRMNLTVNAKSPVNRVIYRKSAPPCYPRRGLGGGWEPMGSLRTAGIIKNPHHPLTPSSWEAGEPVGAGPRACLFHLPRSK